MSRPRKPRFATLLPTSLLVVALLGTLAHAAEYAHPEAESCKKEPELAERPAERPGSTLAVVTPIQIASSADRTVHPSFQEFGSLRG